MANIDEVVSRIHSKVSEGQVVVFVSGNFNIIHPGHLRLLNFAAACGDFLVLGINAKGSSKDIYVPIDLRMEAASCLSMVDFVFDLGVPPEEFILKLKPDIVIKGKEHEGKLNPEQQAVANYGGKLMFSSGEVSFSSLDLVKQEIGGHAGYDIEIFQEYLDRHKIRIQDLKNVLLNFAGKKIAVIGDLIVDEYIMCNPLGMSQEDPTIVVTPLVSKLFIGGAAIVAAHAQGLGASVQFFTITGDDDCARFAKTKLGEYGVKSYLFGDINRPTPNKIRYRAQGKTLLRVNRLSQRDIENDIQDSIIESFQKNCSDINALIFSDFNYGCLPQQLVDRLISFCLERGIRIFGDSQSSSQIGDISRFKNMLAITPTEREARLALHDFNSGLAVLADKLMIKSNAENVVMTLGEEGVMVYTGSQSERIRTDQLPSMNRNPKDVSGAGDSFLTTLSLALISGADIWQSCYLASISAGLQVSRVGNIPLTKRDILLELDKHL